MILPGRESETVQRYVIMRAVMMGNLEEILIPFLVLPMEQGLRVHNRRVRILHKLTKSSRRPCVPHGNGYEVMAGCGFGTRQALKASSCAGLNLADSG